MKEICPMCEEGILTPYTRTGTINCGTITLEVDEIEFSICDTCGATPVSKEQAERNQKRYQTAKENHWYNVCNTR